MTEPEDPRSFQQLSEARNDLDQFDRLYKSLVARLETSVADTAKLLASPSIQHRHETRTLNSISLAGPAKPGIPIPITLLTWKLPGTQYYVAPSIGGLITVANNSTHGVVTAFKQFIQVGNPDAHDQYLEIIGALGRLVEEIQPAKRRKDGMDT